MLPALCTRFALVYTARLAGAFFAAAFFAGAFFAGAFLAVAFLAGAFLAAAFFAVAFLAGALCPFMISLVGWMSRTTCVRLGSSARLDQFGMR